MPAAPLPANEAKRLEALRRHRILDTPAEQIFDDFVLVASALFDTPMAAVTLVDAGRQWFKASTGLGTMETPRDQAFCAYAILGEDTLIVEDARADTRFSDNPLVTAAPHIRFYAGAPLIDSQGFALGSVCVIDQRPRTLTPAQQAALEALTRRVMSQLEFRKVSHDLADALEEKRALQELLPLCAHCHSVRDDAGYWQQVDDYLASHTGSEISHGVCPKCLMSEFPEVYAQMKAAGKV